MTADMEALFPDLTHAPHDDVVDRAGVDSSAIEGGIQDFGGRLEGMPSRKRPVSAASGGACRRYDISCGHGWNLRVPDSYVGDMRVTCRSTRLCASRRTRPCLPACPQWRTGRST